MEQLNLRSQIPMAELLPAMSNPMGQIPRLTQMDPQRPPMITRQIGVEPTIALAMGTTNQLQFPDYASRNPKLGERMPENLPKDESQIGIQEVLRIENTNWSLPSHRALVDRSFLSFHSFRSKLPLRPSQYKLQFRPLSS